jgi:hypothetical protein
MIICSQFVEDARLISAREGMSELQIVPLSVSGTMGRPQSELEKVAKESVCVIIERLTKTMLAASITPRLARSKPVEVHTFKGEDYVEAVENMEKFFLTNRWSDGLPLIPPTRDAVKAMLKGTSLSPDHVVGVIAPKGGVATVEKIAVNAVMAGARAAYMPLIIAAVESLTDPAFDLTGVQCTGGLAAPLLIVSGSIVKDLNINFSFSTAGPGWRANSSIGRAIRLILINIGQAWPGVNDMKDVGNPAKFGILIAENEEQTPLGWQTLREQEGFSKDVSTVSIFASQSYRQVGYPLERVIEQMKTALNALARHWGKEIVVVLSPTTAETLALNGFKPASVQKELFDKGRILRKNFGPRPLGKIAVGISVPRWIDELPGDQLVPIVPRPEDIKVFVSGGRGPGASFFIDGWGMGTSQFVTKEIKLPSNWSGLLDELQGWITPIVVK